MSNLKHIVLGFFMKLKKESVMGHKAFYWSAGTTLTQQMVSPTATTETPLLESPQKKTSRQVHIDVIRVGLTWGILLFHTVLIYMPSATYHIKDPFMESPNGTTSTVADMVSNKPYFL